MLFPPSDAPRRLDNPVRTTISGKVYRGELTCQLMPLSTATFRHQAPVPGHHWQQVPPHGLHRRSMASLGTHLGCRMHRVGPLSYHGFGRRMRRLPAQRCMGSRLPWRRVPLGWRTRPPGTHRHVKAQVGASCFGIVGLCAARRRSTTTKRVDGILHVTSLQQPAPCFANDVRVPLGNPSARAKEHSGERPGAAGTENRPVSAWHSSNLFTHTAAKSATLSPS